MSDEPALTGKINQCDPIAATLASLGEQLAVRQPSEKRLALVHQAAIALYGRASDKEIKARIVSVGHSCGWLPNDPVTSDRLVRERAQRGLDDARFKADLARGGDPAVLARADKAAPVSGDTQACHHLVTAGDREKPAPKEAKESAERPGDDADDLAQAREEFRKQATDLLKAPNILQRFGEAIEAGGLIGETRNAKILYLVTTTRLFKRPASAAIKGPSSGGKSYLVDKTLAFFPKEAYVATTSMSDHSLVYDDEDYRHRMLVIYEAAGMVGDKLSYFIRTLLSEGCIEHSVTERNSEGRFVVRKIRKEGPTGLITTTTAASLHPENETRMISLGVQDSPEQTRAIMLAIAGGDDEPHPDYAPWHALQNYLATGERRVVIPYAKALAKEIPTTAVRLRRDFKTLLNLIRAHALLHQENRKRDSNGRIVASHADYEAVRLLANSVFSEGIKATVSKETRKTVEAVAKLVAAGKPEGVSQAALCKELNLDKAAISHRVRKAIDGGYVVNLETKDGLPARLVLGEPLPDEVEVLPKSDRWAVEELFEGVPEENGDTTPASAGTVEIIGDTPDRCGGVEGPLSDDTDAELADLEGGRYPPEQRLNASTAPENASENSARRLDGQTQRGANSPPTASADGPLEGGTVELLSGCLEGYHDGDAAADVPAIESSDDWPDQPGGDDWIESEEGNPFMGIRGATCPLSELPNAPRPAWAEAGEEPEEPPF
jgi:hypothetical protein